jgi:hypothetical protein
VQRLLVDNLASNNLVLLSKCKLEAAREAALLGGFGVGGWGVGVGVRKIELFFICPSQRQIVGVHTPIHKIKSIRFTKPNKYAIKHAIKREFVRESRIDADVGVFP